MWKPGQLITHKHKVYKVRKFIYYDYPSEKATCPCHLCSLSPMDNCIPLCGRRGNVPRDCYLKEIQRRDKSTQK